MEVTEKIFYGKKFQKNACFLSSDMIEFPSGLIDT
jgi:hypothetical protein